jgi:excisionase family DNA binding protein
MPAKLLTVVQVAERLDRHEKLVYRWISEGRLRGQKYGMAVMVDERDLVRFEKDAPMRRDEGLRRTRVAKRASDRRRR